MLPDPSPTVTVDGLLLRPLRAADEIAAREADAELHREGFDFLMAGTRSFPAIRRAFAAEARGTLLQTPGSPEAVAKEVVNNTDSRQMTFAPVIHVNGADQATSSALADQVIAKMRGEFVPLMMANPLAVRRGAALTDGSD